VLIKSPMPRNQTRGRRREALNSSIERCRRRARARCAASVRFNRLTDHVEPDRPIGPRGCRRADLIVRARPRGKVQAPRTSIEPLSWASSGGRAGIRDLDLLAVRSHHHQGLCTFLR